MFATIRSKVQRVAVVSALAGSMLFQFGVGGCDGGLDLLGGMGGYYPDYGYSGWGYFPDYGLYDPTDTIQSVVDYRQSVMDWSANAWSDYILQ
jgi:hypothetical protein